MMGDVTHPAIVSMSGYTDGARRKAGHHGVELFALKPWEGRIEERFPESGLRGTPEEMDSGRLLLCWKQWSYTLFAPNGPRVFTGTISGPFRHADGSKHRIFGSPSRFVREILQRSTEQLFSVEPALTISHELYSAPTFEPGWVGPSWPQTHVVELALDDVYLACDGQLVQVEQVQIDGTLQWSRDRARGAHYLLERDSDGAPFAGALVALGARDEHLFAFVVSPDSRTHHVHVVTLEPKHLKVIRRLRIGRPS